MCFDRSLDFSFLISALMTCFHTHFNGFGMALFGMGNA